MANSKDYRQDDKFMAFVEWSCFPKGMLDQCFVTYETPLDEFGESQRVVASEDVPEHLAQFLDDGSRRALDLPALSELKSMGHLDGKVPVTLDEMAAIVGVSSRTLYNWRKTEEFEEEREFFLRSRMGQDRAHIVTRSLHMAKTGDEKSQKEREMWLKTFGDIDDSKTLRVEGEVHHTHEQVRQASIDQLRQMALRELEADPRFKGMNQKQLEAIRDTMVTMVTGAKIDEDRLLTPTELTEQGGKDFLMDSMSENPYGLDSGENDE